MCWGVVCIVCCGMGGVDVMLIVGLVGVVGCWFDGGFFYYLGLWVCC